MFVYKQQHTKKQKKTMMFYNFYMYHNNE